jgi:hypothetical protein
MLAADVAGKPIISWFVDVVTPDTATVIVLFVVSQALANRTTVCGARSPPLPPPDSLALIHFWLVASYLRICPSERDVNTTSVRVSIEDAPPLSFTLTHF